MSVLPPSVSLGSRALGFTVQRADGARAAGDVELGIDYSGFADAYGGGYADRLQVLAYPGCVLTTPSVPDCQQATTVPSRNDRAAQRLSVTVSALPPGAAAPVAAPAAAPRTGSSGPGGTKRHAPYRAQVPPMSAYAKVAASRGLPVAASPALTAVPSSSGRASSGRTLSGTGRLSTAAAVVYAVSAGASGPDGTYQATSLKANGNWSVGTQSGSFDYSYPIAVPPATVGEDPDVALTYSSQAVDGFTSRENRQAVVGTGWDLPVPFIERKFLPCQNDPYQGSMCWAGENAVISLNGHTSTLVPLAADSDDTPFAMVDDAGYRIQRENGYAGNPNGDGAGRYWKVVSPDGTRYYFGRERSEWQSKPNNSTLTQPVISPKSGDPCYDGGSNVCTMAYRWNLSYVVDPHGNLTSYKYGKDRYTYQPRSGVYWDYDGDSRLFDIDYGQTLGNAASTKAPQRVEFAYRWRCESWVQTYNCEAGDVPKASNAQWYPDIPFDMVCTTVEDTRLCPNGAPRSLVYYSLRRLDAIATSYLKPDGTRQTVDTTYFGHAFMYGTSDWTSASMYIGSLWQTGGGDDTKALPPTTFGYTMKPNIWANGSGSGNRPRLSDVVTELGGRTRVTYGQPDPCSAAQNDLARSQNASDCYQVRSSDGSAQFFQKWLVTQVEVIDRDGAPTQTTRYAYSANSNPGGAAPSGEGAGWHSDEDLVTPLAQQGWTQFRGYQKVKVSTADASGRTATEVYKYFRGLNGDYSSGSDRSQRRSDQVRTALYDGSDTPAAPATWGRSVPDANPLQGQLLEHRTLGADGVERLADQHDYTVATLAPGPKDKAGYAVLPVTRAQESTTTTLYAAGGRPRVRQHVLTSGYDGYGRQIWEQDGGDSASGIGPSCTWTTYASNTELYVLDSEQRVIEAAGACGSSEPTTGLFGRTDTLYDGSATPGAVTAGDPTEVMVWTGPAGPPGAVTGTRTRYDSSGRVTAALSADQYAAADPVWQTTTYDDSTGPITSTTVTDEAGATSTVVLDPGRGAALSSTDANGRTTVLRYDDFGRLTAVRRPGDSYDTTTYGYTLDQDRGSPARVASTTYSAPGQGVTGYAYIDSLGRTFQTESPSPAAGQRIISGTRYDEDGNAVAAVSGIVVGGTPGTAVSGWYDPTWTAGLPSTTRTTYDEFDRETSESLYAAGSDQPLWKGTSSYDGFSSTSAPPSNSGASEPDLAPTTVTTDVFGRPLTRSQGGRTTTNTYDVAGNLVKITSALGKVSTYAYDWAGRRTSSTDPDAGTSTVDYYPSGTVRHSRDANGQDLFSAIDRLGRVTATYAGTDATGTKLTQTVYDGVPLGGSTPLKGAVTSMTSWNHGNAYTEAYGYDQRYRVVRTDQTIPDVTGSPIGTLAGTYSTTATYDDADRATSVGYPAAGGLAAETVTTGWSGGYATTLSSPLGTYVSATGYTNIGQLASRVLGTAGATGSVNRSYTYDLPTGRLTNETAATPSTLAAPNVENDSYTYTPGGDVSKITDALAGQRQCFGYDPLDRLVTASTSAAGSQTGTACTADGTGPAPYDQSFGYDADGNLTSQVSGGVTTVYGYGDNAALGLTGGPHAPTTATKGGTTSTYSYDADGQLVRRVSGGVTTTYGWTADQRLASVTVGSATSTFVDGPTGDRWIRQSPTETVAYLAGQELHLAAGSSAVSAIRYYSLDDHTVGERRTGSGAGLFWLLGDRQSSVSIAVDAATGAVGRDRYLPFGGNRATSSTLPTDRGWLGQTRDPDTGLDYLNARYYDPELAHFISVDPLDVQASPQDANPYTYAADNPVTFADPSGLMRIDPSDLRRDPAPKKKAASTKQTAAKKRQAAARAKAAARARAAARAKVAAAAARAKARLAAKAKADRARKAKAWAKAEAARKAKARERLRKATGQPDKDRTSEHNLVVQLAKPVIEAQARAQGWEGEVRSEVRVTAATKNKKNAGQEDGFADLVYVRTIRDQQGNVVGTKYYVWEVKSMGQVQNANPEAQWYVDHMIAEESKDAEVGWDLSRKPQYYRGQMSFDDGGFAGFGSGAIGYGPEFVQDLRNRITNEMENAQHGAFG